MHSPPSLGGIQPRFLKFGSWSPHVAFGYDLVADLRPRVLVELGTQTGESYFAFCQSAEENRTGTICYAVNPWQAGPSAGQNQREWQEHNQAFYGTFSHLVCATSDDALTRFVDGSLDLIHFDGPTTEGALRHLFDAWRGKLSPRGVALFHDISGQDDAFGAAKCWESIRRHGESFEFRHGAGLGVWQSRDGEPSRTPLLRALFSAGPAQAENIRHYYVMASDALRQRVQGPNGRNGHGENEAALNGHGQVALRNGPAPARRVFPANGPVLRVFFPGAGHGFQEENSECHLLVPNRWERIEVLLPESWRGQSLRIDPGRPYGVADIAGVRIVSTVMDEVIWELRGGEPPDGVRVSGGARAVPDAHVLRLFCVEGDPHLRLPDIDLQGRDEPMRLEIGIRWRNDLASLAPTLQEWARAVQDLADLRVRQEAGEKEADESTDAMQDGGGRGQPLAELKAQLAASRAEAERLAAEIQTARTQAAGAGANGSEPSPGELADDHRHPHDIEAELCELREEKELWEQDREFLRKEISGLYSELQALDETLVKAGREHANTHEALLETQARAEADRGRVKSMQRSASWRMTLPLRVVRRAVSGHRRGTRPAGTLTPLPSAKEMAARNGGYLFQLDAPSDWNLPSQQTRVRGWCLPPPGRRVPGLLVRCGEHATNIRCDVARPDVLASHQAAPESILSGFDAKIKVPGGPSRVTIEAIDEHGKAWLVGQYKVRAPYAARARQGSADGNPTEDYATWVALYDTLTSDDRRRIRAAARGLSYRPLISVVMPVYNTPEKWLAKAIDSVRRQLYPFWELCIADDRSPEGHVREILSRYERLDPRIKVCFREKNGHISEASNSAVELATGEFVALLDHDDELAIHALYAVALELQSHPEADLLYSDEDKLDEEGVRFAPYFKPQWNPDLLLGQNFISHLGVYRREVLKKAGGFRVGCEGCQDWDLALRISEQIPASHIRHVPGVLYHWRAIEGSTARAVEEKDYIVEAARRVIRDHCERTGKDAEILPVRGSHSRVRHRLPETPLVSIVIPTHNQLKLLRQGIEALRSKTTYPNYELVVVDNRSDDPAALAYLEDLERRGAARVLRYPHPFNYSAINNFAVAHAAGELVCLMNNDMEVITPDWLEEMASQALRPGIGAVGAMLYYPDDTIQHAGVILGLGGVAGHLFSRMPRHTDGYFNRARLVQNFTAVTAACLVVRRSTYQQVGGFNERLKVAFNDVDFCLKLHTGGWRNLWTPHAEFYHHESASRGLEDTAEKHQRFVGEVEYMQEHWQAMIADDPAYNLNLWLEDGECRLASPPRLELLRA